MSDQNNPTIHHFSLDKYFKAMPNQSVEDPRLSWAAKGLLWYIVSRKEDWTVHTNQLASIYDGEKRGNGRDAVREMIAELKKLGYIKYQLLKNEDGQWIHRYDIYPIPYEDFQKMFPETVKPSTVNPHTVKPSIITRKEEPRNDLNKVVVVRARDGGPVPHASADVVACGAVVVASGGEKEILKKDKGKPASAEVNFTTTKGEKRCVTKSAIYKHFLPIKEYSTDIIDEAIDQITPATQVNNLLKYLEAVCKAILKKRNETPKKVETKKPEKPYTPEKQEKEVYGSMKAMLASGKFKKGIVIE